MFCGQGRGCSVVNSTWRILSTVTKRVGFLSCKVGHVNIIFMR